MDVAIITPCLGHSPEYLSGKDGSIWDRKPWTIQIDTLLISNIHNAAVDDEIVMRREKLIVVLRRIISSVGTCYGSIVFRLGSATADYLAYLYIRRYPLNQVLYQYLTTYLGTPEAPRLVSLLK